VPTTTQDVRLEQTQFIEITGLQIERLGRRPRHKGAGMGSVFGVLDVCVIAGSGVLAYAVCNSMGAAQLAAVPRIALVSFLAFYVTLFVTCNAVQGLYNDTKVYAPGVRAGLLKGFFVSSAVMLVMTMVADERYLPRNLLGVTTLSALVGLLSMRYGMQRQNMKRIERGIGTQHVLIVGAGEIGRAFQRYLEENRHLGKIFCGFIDSTQLSNPNWLGTPDDLPRIVKEHFIDEIYFTPGISRDLIMDVAMQARQERISVNVVPDLYDGLALGAGVSRVGEVPVLELNHLPNRALALFFKRVMDLCIAVPALLVTAPVMLASALAIKFDSPGPVFYAAWRVGRKGRRFRCYKFRSMVADADVQKDDLRQMNERNGATFKMENDPRITAVGRFLRKYSIDELPQLFNVLRGEMSMVGPRPHPVDDYNLYHLEDLRRLDVLPGITGLWQVSARRDPSFEKNVLLDLEYIENWNVILDLKIALRTIPEVFRGSGH
jgi:exopolysaccharide biosynthesis polyprenyl glycosylphosphotransferase